MCDRVVRRLSKLRLSEGRFGLIFCLTTNLLFKSYQREMTTQRLSRYLKVVTGLSQSGKKLS